MNETGFMNFQDEVARFLTNIAGSSCFILRYRCFRSQSFFQVCDLALDVLLFCCGRHLPGVFSPVHRAQHSTW